MADKYEMELGLNISQFEKGLSTLERRLQTMASRLQNSSTKVPVPSIESVKQYKSPTLSSQSDIRQYARLSGALASNQIVGARLSSKTAMGPMTGIDNTFLARSVQEAWANVASKIGASATPQLQKAFVTEFNETVRGVLTPLRDKKGAALGRAYTESTKDIFLGAGAAPASMLTPGKAPFLKSLQFFTIENNKLVNEAQ